MRGVPERIREHRSSIERLGGDDLAAQLDDDEASLGRGDAVEGGEPRQRVAVVDTAEPKEDRLFGRRRRVRTEAALRPSRRDGKLPPAVADRRLVKLGMHGCPSYAAAATGSGRTNTVSATWMISSAGRSARRACSLIASGLLAW